MKELPPLPATVPPLLRRRYLAPFAAVGSAALAPRRRLQLRRGRFRLLLRDDLRMNSRDLLWEFTAEILK